MIMFASRQATQSTASNNHNYCDQPQAPHQPHPHRPPAVQMARSAPSPRARASSSSRSCPLRRSPPETSTTTSTRRRCTGSPWTHSRSSTGVSTSSRPFRRLSSSSYDRANQQKQRLSRHSRCLRRRAAYEQRNPQALSCQSNSTSLVLALTMLKEGWIYGNWQFTGLSCFPHCQKWA